MASSVLIVEDEWLIAEDHAETLREADYEVVGPCATVRDALAAIDHNHVDAACLDVELLNERSYAIAERLQQLGIPFVFLSGHDERDLPPIMRRREVLPKPVEPARLLAAVAGMTHAA